MTARPPPETPTLHDLAAVTDEDLDGIEDSGVILPEEVPHIVAELRRARTPAPRSAPETRPSREEVECALDEYAWAVIERGRASAVEAWPPNGEELAARSALLSLLGYEVKP